MDFGIRPGVVGLHWAVSIFMAGIEFPASCAAGMFVEEGPFLKGKGREAFLLNVFGLTGTGGKGASLGQWVSKSGE